MEKQITAIDWLINRLQIIEVYPEEAADAIKQAKDMEKQQIMDAWNDGASLDGKHNVESYLDKLYNETFKQ